MSRKPRHVRMFECVCLCVCMCVVFIPGLASENGVFRGKLVNSQDVYFQILEVLFQWKVFGKVIVYSTTELWVINDECQIVAKTIDLPKWQILAESRVGLNWPPSHSEWRDYVTILTQFSARSLK